MICCYYTNLFITFPIFKGFQRKALYKLSQILDTIQNICQDCSEAEREAPDFPQVQTMEDFNNAEREIRESESTKKNLVSLLFVAACGK